jgi:hypothetical protein
MRYVANALSSLSAAAWVLLSAFPVMAEEEQGAEDTFLSARADQDGQDRWVPSLAIVTGMTIQGWSGSVESQICRGCPIPDPAMGEEPLRPAATGDDNDVTPFLGANIELMTPTLPIPTSPRIFVGGEAMAAFGFERIVAGEGDPSELSSPLPNPDATTPYSQNVVLGQGSQTLAQLRGGMYGAYMGIAFPFEIYGRPLRAKPSVGWTRYRVEAQGLVVSAECAPRLTSTQCNTNRPDGFLREIRLEGSDSRTFDGVGPGIDIEMDTGRLGQLGTSIFLGARFFRILGDRNIDFGAAELYDDVLGTDTTGAVFHYEMDEWMYRINLGFRVHWLGPE